ncbi:succinyl-CoA synthetase (ADP-forming) alpha subunit [Archaeoglobus sulfaticallidus PM70-1]|uniref:Succinate--CoA ligase [ADP-forming] subunit alpha n=1 Tax=Archaeoglobus sulfaticallidus PM70-1 TaxID=387631 RepID=N0BDH5_9EURY|nr:succinate--CoA ligase subunit alpha [Archaeoglobus sulfaticallidus]AGK60307.1 succinyl-CoA synthetase (ADP-forming) alpha subunit [Archaeoglobus sulfaticallidus PM70-1]
MAILVDENTRVIVQGITGFQGSFQTKRMLDYGTKIVGGVSPGKGGQEVYGVPVFNTMEEAMVTDPNTSIIYVPARFAYDAILEALDAGIGFVVCVTEGVPLYEEMKLSWIVRDYNAMLLGPNCPGVISPGKSKVGLLPDRCFIPGDVGVVSRSGTLTYQVAENMTKAGIGQSTVVGIGGDPIPGLTFVDVLQMFEEDKETKRVVLIGEIGGNAEEVASEYIKEMSKPVYAFLAGRTAPRGKRMGHAGAIIEGFSGTAESKTEALEKAGVRVAKTLEELIDLLKED